MKLRAALSVILICGLVLCGLAATAQAQQHDLALEGVVDYTYSGRYLYLDFIVPEGVTKLRISKSWSVVTPPDNGADGIIPSNRVDMGVFDPHGFRGWGKGTIYIAESAEQTTPGYVPGAIPAGTWQVELGVGWMAEDTQLSYRVTIDFFTDPAGELFVLPEIEPTVISDQPGWYKGDLHCHSTHSDGSRSMAEVFEYAHSIGLDYIALTDHNVISHHFFTPEFQEQYDDMLLIYATELTSYQGHANVFNVVGYFPYQMTDTGFDVNELIDQVHDQGGYFSPNHPVSFNYPDYGMLFGLGWGFLETDWDKVDFLEVLNGPMVVEGGLPNPANLLDIELWDGLQAKGHVLPMRGGSDDHAGGQGSGLVKIGSPTTVVYAEELSAAGILDGLCQGHSFLMAAGPDGPELYLEASAGKQQAIMGDTIAADTVEMTVRVINGQGTRLRLLVDGSVWEGYEYIPVDQDPFELSLLIQPAAPQRLRAEVWRDTALLAITNTLSIEPGLPDDDDDDDDDSDDDDAVDDDDDADDDDDKNNDSACCN